MVFKVKVICISIKCRLFRISSWEKLFTQIKLWLILLWLPNCGLACRTRMTVKTNLSNSVMSKFPSLSKLVSEHL